MKKIMIILIGLGCQLFAHTLWIDDVFRVHQGHMYQEHLQESKSSVHKKEIASIYCLKNGAVKKSNQLSVSKQECRAVFMMLHANYYTKTPYGTKKTSKDKSKMPIKSWLSIESVKRLYSDEKQVFGQGLELVMRNNISKIEVGNKARLTVYLDGKPLKGAVVANGHKTIGISDKEGHINVKIREKGLQNIKASYSLKGDSVKCDKIIHTTTVNFEVSK